MGKREVKRGKLSVVKMMVVVGHGWKRRRMRRRVQGVNHTEISPLHTRLQLKLNLGSGGTSVMFGCFQPLLLLLLLQDQGPDGPDVGPTSHTSYLGGGRMEVRVA